MSVPVVKITTLQNTVPGRKISYRAAISSNPNAISAKWQKVVSDNFTEVDITDEKYAGSSIDIDRPVLVVKTDQNDDPQAEYQLVVSNDIGDGQSCRIKLKDDSDLPLVTIELEGNNEMSLGETAIYTAVVKSKDTPSSFSWQKIKTDRIEDININMEKYQGSLNEVFNPKLVINNVDFTDMASYQLIIYTGNGVGQSNSVELTVEGPPQIDVTGASKTVYGEKTTFVASITSNPAVTSVQWEKLVDNQMIVIDINDQKYEGSSVDISEPVLIINDTKFNDQAEYGITVANIIGKCTSNRIILEVEGGLPAPTILGPTTLVYGETLEIVSQVNCRPVATSAKWQIIDANSELSFIDLTLDKYEGSSNEVSAPKLIIKSGKFEDEAIYRLCVWNDIGCNTSNELDVKVNGDVGSAIITGPTISSCGEDVIFEVSSITCKPRAITVDWQSVVNGICSIIDTDQPKYQGSSLYNEKTRLVINSVDITDQKTYQLKITNALGTGTSNKIHLAILGGRPSIDITGVNVVKEGHDAILKAKIISHSEITEVVWQKVCFQTKIDFIEDIDVKRQKYAGSSVNTSQLEHICLVIKNCTKKDMARYQLKVTNSDGHHISEEFSLVTEKVVTSEVADHDKEKNNLLRMYLLMQVGTKAIRMYFDTVIQPSALQGHLMTWKKKVTPFLSAHLYQRIFKGNQITSDNLDLSSMYTLMRNTCSHISPTIGWGMMPSQSHKTKMDDVERLRMYRNGLSHFTNNKICDQNFQKMWKECSDAVLRLSDNLLLSEVSELQLRIFNVNTRNDLLEKFHDSVLNLQDEILDILTRLNDIENQTSARIEEYKAEHMQLLSDLRKEVEESKREICVTSLPGPSQTHGPSGHTFSFNASTISFIAHADTVNINRESINMNTNTTDTANSTK